MSDGDPALEEALILHQRGEFEAAQGVLRQYLEFNPTSADGLHLMALCEHAMNRNDTALEWLVKAIAQQPEEAVFLSNAGMIAFGCGRLELAEGFLERAVAANAQHAESFNNFALVRERQARFDEAAALLEKAIMLKPDFAMAYANHGNVLRAIGSLDRAITEYQNAILISPMLAAPHNGLGNTFRQMDRRVEAIESFDRAISLDPGYADAYFNRAMTRAAQGETAKAEQDLAQAYRLRPDHRFLVADAGLLPVIPASETEIIRWRERFIRKFKELSEGLVPINGDPEQVGAMNFYLAYHGENDREHMEQLAAFYAKAFPDLLWTAPHCNSSDKREGRLIRLGVASKNFGEHAVAWMIFGLLAQLPRDQFSVTAIVPSRSNEGVSDRISDAVDDVLHISTDIKFARQQIADKRFDILLYADIGMEPFSYFLAFSRLAPVQCVTWGHPDTTGLRSIDYFISNDIAEPEDGQESYTESLVRLPGVQSWYPRLSRSEPLPSRQDIGLPSEGAIYLCPQNLIKIHPEMDANLADLLARDPEGHLVIFGASDLNWTRLLLARWKPVFGRNFERVLVLPRVSLQTFVDTIALSDVVLDTWPFGAGNTNYQTFAIGVPVVTLPGRWIRGRGTLAHYTHMGIDDCVAQSPAEFVEIAHRLGTDHAFRKEIAAQIEARSDAVLEDEVCANAFAKFLAEVRAKA